jgi:hypothetical protein
VHSYQQCMHLLAGAVSHHLLFYDRVQSPGAIICLLRLEIDVSVISHATALIKCM